MHGRHAGAVLPGCSHHSACICGGEVKQDSSDFSDCRRGHLFVHTMLFAFVQTLLFSCSCPAIAREIIIVICGGLVRLAQRSFPRNIMLSGTHNFCPLFKKISPPLGQNTARAVETGCLPLSIDLNLCTQIYCGSTFTFAGGALERQIRKVTRPEHET